MLMLMRREIRLLLAERKLIFLVLIGAASAYALLIGNLYRGHVVEHIQIAVCDLDGSVVSRELVRGLAAADKCEMVAVLSQEETGIEYLHKKKAVALMVIPPNFGKDLTLGQPVKVEVLSDGSNSLYQSYSLAPLQEVVGSISGQYQSKALAKNGLPQALAAPVQISWRLPENAAQSYALFYLYGVMLTAAQIGLMVSFSLSIHKDWRIGLFARWGFARVIAAKELVYVGLSLASMMVALTIITGFFKLPYQGSIGEFIILYLAFALAVANMAGVSALYFKTELALMQCLVFYTLPSFLLSGYIWPEIGMLPVVRWLSYLLPVHYTAMEFRSLALSGSAPNLIFNVYVLLAMTVLFVGFIYQKYTDFSEN